MSQEWQRKGTGCSDAALEAEDEEEEGTVLQGRDEGQRAGWDRRVGPTQRLGEGCRTAQKPARACHPFRSTSTPPVPGSRIHHCASHPPKAHPRPARLHGPRHPDSGASAAAHRHGQRAAM